MIKKNLKKRIYTSLLLVLLIFLMLNYNIILAYTLIILGTLSIIEFLNLTKKTFKTKFKLLTSNFFFIIYILLFCYIFFFFSNISNTVNSKPLNCLLFYFGIDMLFIYLFIMGIFCAKIINQNNYTYSM